MAANRPGLEGKAREDEGGEQGEHRQACEALHGQLLGRFPGTRGTVAKGVYGGC